ncbi:MAG TPA: glycosyl hydrolase family 28 protein, partial [Bacillota bacterium]|nr:glycosyl hydrolase family 28 protein [Bacillota bacterium]
MNGNNQLLRSAALALTLLSLVLTTRAAQVITWPAPVGEPLATNYQVTVEGKPVPVYIAPSVHGGDYAFATFDFTGKVKVTVTGSPKLAAAAILPKSAGLTPKNDGNTLTLTLDHPCKLSIEPDGINSPLLLFANAPEKDAPQPTDPNVVYFGPGIHKPERIVLKAGQTLYLAGGAVVKGAIIAEKADHLRICGRGILDGTDWPWLKGPAGHMVRIQDSKDVTIQDIIIRGSFAWTVVPMRCAQVNIRNIKIVASRVQNDDGINPCNSQDVLIEDCFVRTDDDCVALKGLAHLNTPPTPVRNITVRRCIFWCDRARIFLLGHESQASAMENLLYQDCDIVHFVMTPFLLEPGEEMPLRHARFENLRLAGQGLGDFITLQPTVNQYMKVKTPGSLSNIVFKDITLQADTPGKA